MQIVTIGRGNIGSGLAELWREAGHVVDTLGKEGGDASGADVVLVAVPTPELAAALESVSGLAGKTVIDATNVWAGREVGAPSNAEFIQSVTGGPVAKAFNMNFAALFSQVRAQRVPPTNVYVSDDDAAEVTEQLIRDAGYDPLRVGGLDKALKLEDAVWLLMGAMRPGQPVFYRFSLPGDV